jgi:hypothetical protein
MNFEERRREQLMSSFVNGLALNERFYQEIAAPLLKSYFPDLRYSAALIGWGSDVLGYDDLQSTDHNWGIRFQLFLPEHEYERGRRAVNDILNEHLPAEFGGYPVAFEMVVNEDQRGEDASLRHNIEIETIGRYLKRYLGYDPQEEPTAADWLTFSEHKLLGVTSGRVFHDGLGELELVRQKIRCYPRDVWLYLLAAQWEKISEEAAFVGRCGYVGDELGSRLIATRQVKNLMRLCFLMERRYVPYSKWFGTAFHQLNCAKEINPVLVQVLQAPDWQVRQQFLAQAYEAVARLHNALGITTRLSENAEQYFNRPYLVMGDGRYGEELRKLIASEEVRNIRHLLGSVNQFVDSHDKLNDLELCRKLKGLYV